MAAHLTPQAPQLPASLEKLTQVAPHASGFDGSEQPPCGGLEQAPLAHTRPRAQQVLPHMLWPVGQQTPLAQVPLHAAPQLPQLLLSVKRLTQAPPHSVGVLAGQLPMTQVPLAHTWPDGQQLLPHMVWPAWQQTPLAQVPLHTAPHLPQLLLSLERLTQVPPHSVGSAGVHCGGMTKQAPFTHAWLDGQQPLPHMVRPGPQQTPLAQVPLHAAPHLPQLLLSLEMSTQTRPPDPLHSVDFGAAQTQTPVAQLEPVGQHMGLLSPQ